MQKQLSFQTTVTIIATFGLLIFTIFQFIEGSFFDTVMEFRIIFAGIVYISLAILLFFKNPLLGLLLMGAGGFLLYAYFIIFHGISFSLQNASVYQIILAVLATVCFISGLTLYKRNQDIDRLLAHILLPICIIGIVLIVSDNTLPKPYRNTGVSGILGLFIFIFMVIAGSTASHLFWINKNKPGYVLAIIYRLVSFGGLFFCVLWLNNVIYNGCYPDAPIGCPCTLNQKTVSQHDSLPTIDNKDTVEIKPLVPEVITIPVGGSLCGSLGMTLKEAKEFAKNEGLKIFKKGRKTIVVILPGDKFKKVAGSWKRIN